MSVQIAKRYFNVSEYYRMAEAGILTADDRVELIDGEIVKMSPIGSQHAACVKRLNQILQQQFGATAVIGVQDPVRLNEFSEPEPDVTLLRARSDFYAQQHPTPADVLLLIEVSDTTVLYDRNIKVPLYARAGVPEVWLIDLQQEIIEVYAQPAGGAYQVQRQAQRGEQVQAETIAQLSLNVDDILG
jgi:Uma2 family endonuclease